MSDREGSSGGGAGGGAGSGDREQRSGSRTSAWEWAVAALGALVVFGVVGFMLWEAFTAPETTPRIEVATDSVRATAYGYVVPLSIHNHGSQTAAMLVVEGVLRSDTGVVERAQATIDFVPPRATRHGGLLFTVDPRRYDLEVRGQGYDRP